jgi:L-aminopeptidase/D-esterase-like protein
MNDKYQDSIVAVRGIEVGHAQNDIALTGCTVILCRKGAVAGVDVRGSAPGTRETDLLDPINLVEKVHAIVLAGGSAFGLDAAGGAMRYLEEHKVGFNTGVARVPIVPAAILYDLNLGDKNVRPDAEMGYQACLNASADRVVEGNVGAGSGASVGKLFGNMLAMKSGVGSASIDIGNGIIVGAIAALNAWGDVIEAGKIIAGLRSGRVGPLRVGSREYFADTLKMMRTLAGRNVMRLATKANTVIGAVATNAALTKVEATKVAQMAHDGLARAIRPAHTMLDGDTIFALSTGNKQSDVTTIGSFAAEAMARAIIHAAQMSAPAGGLPGLKT